MDNSRLLNELEIVDEWSRIPHFHHKKINDPCDLDLWLIDLEMVCGTLSPHGLYSCYMKWARCHRVDTEMWDGRTDRWSEANIPPQLHCVRNKINCFVLCIWLFLLYAYHDFICSVEVLYCFQIWQNCGQILHPWMECMFMVEIGNMWVLLPNNNNINSMFSNLLYLASVNNRYLAVWKTYLKRH